MMIEESDLLENRVAKKLAEKLNLLDDAPMDFNIEEILPAKQDYSQRRFSLIALAASVFLASVVSIFVNNIWFSKAQDYSSNSEIQLLISKSQALELHLSEQMSENSIATNGFALVNALQEISDLDASLNNLYINEQQTEHELVIQFWEARIHYLEKAIYIIDRKTQAVSI